MKKSNFILILIVLFSIVSCEKKENISTADTKSAIKPGKPFGYVLLDGQSLWAYDETKEASKQWEWLLAMTAGKKVELLDKEPIRLKKGNDEFEWYHVRYNDKEGYAMKYYIGTFDTLAVITTDGAMRFKSPEITGVVSDKALPKGTLLTIPAEDLSLDFCRAYAVYKDGDTIRYIGNIYLKSSDISTQEQDVQGYLLYYIAKSLNDPKAKDDPKRMENLVKAKLEILNEARKKYPFSVFTNLIQEEIYALSGNTNNSTIQTVTSQIEVYENPDLTSQIVGTIEAGTQFTIEEKNTINNDEWLRISKPYNGWILGSKVGQ